MKREPAREETPVAVVAQRLISVVVSVLVGAVRVSSTCCMVGALVHFEGDSFGGPVAMRLRVGGSWSTVG